MDKPRLHVVDQNGAAGTRDEAPRPVWRDKHGRPELRVNPALFGAPAVPRVVKGAVQGK
ncbi:MAG: hypothetical protein Q4F67_10485 [Propionibacteriaceae bacterium]|nr:hypothetical protein [Propionibacteriaceae bacterium]